MNKKMKYSTSIKTKPFLYIELKKMAKFREKNNSLSKSRLKEKALEENIFQYETKNRNKEIASVTLKRLEVLDEFLMDKLIHGSIDISKQIAMYSILKTDRLFYEFMEEVYKEKYLIGDPFLTDRDFNIFFQHKSEQSERVDSWADYTYYKLKQVIIRVLFEANFITDQEERKIKRPIIPKEVIYHLEEKGESKYIKAMLGGI